MPKDPAVLFYTSDFLTGCALMSMAQRGKYITLLCLQHQQGHLSEEDMLDVCGGYDKKIFSKFEQDEDGLYFNKRMDVESNKRKKYVESRQNNLKKTSEPISHMESHMKSHMEEHMSAHMENHMESHMENENENIDKSIFPFSFNNNLSHNERISNERSELDMSSSKDKETDIYIIKGFTPPSLEEVKKYCAERGNNVDAEHFYNYYESNGWRVGRNPMNDWRASIRSWENNGISNSKPREDNGLAKSFEISDFYASALKRSYGG